MEVQEIIVDDNKERYILVNGQGKLVLPAVKYLKYLDNTEKSRNTLKTYCYALKHYFVFLKEIDKSCFEVDLQDLSDFVGWLRNPYESNKVTPMQEVESKRSESTVNLYITVVTNFYDYLYRLEEMGDDLVDKLFKKTFGGKRKYKDFLYHINKDNPIDKNILKIKEPKKKIKPLTKEQVENIYNACNNIRDKFLIRLLLETGLRIGEALALFIEDFIDARGVKGKQGHRIRLKDRGELSNGAKIKTGEREIHITQDLIDMYDDYIFEVVYELNIDTNFLFVKLTGDNKGKPLEYPDVASLFRRLKKKTGIDVHPHLLRHTHATAFYMETKNIKALQERLGHADVQTTMNMYVHPSDEEIRQEWEKASSVFKDYIPDAF